MNFFMENITLMDEVNRTYMWHILYDHVLMNQTEPREFFLTVVENIEAETQEMIIPFLLAKCGWIVQHFPSEMLN